MSSSKGSGLAPLWLKARLEMPCQWVMTASKAFGNETVQISIALHFLEITRYPRRDLTHPKRTAGLIRLLLVLSQKSQNQLILGVMAIDVSLEDIKRLTPRFSVRSHRNQPFTQPVSNIIWLLPLFLFHFTCSWDPTATTLLLTPMDMCCCTLISSHW